MLLRPHKSTDTHVHVHVYRHTFMYTHFAFTCMQMHCICTVHACAYDVYMWRHWWFNYPSLFLHAKLEFPLFIRWYRDTCLALYCLIRPLGQLTFSLKRRESEPSQVVVLCCLALHIVSRLLTVVHAVDSICICTYSVHVCLHLHSIAHRMR